MAKLPLCIYDDPILRRQAQPVEAIDASIVQLANDMIETMIDSNGVGLAANQIGKLIRIFVIRDETMDIAGEYILGPPEVIINPTLSKPAEEKVSMSEGCLSLPGLHVEVMRPKSIHIRYQNLKGEWIEELLEDFKARVVMHENDHLNGVLTIDRISKQEKRKVDQQLVAIKKKRY